MNDLNQPFALIHDRNENIHDHILENNFQNHPNLKERLKFIINAILFRIPILYVCDIFYANSAYFYNQFEHFFQYFYVASLGVYVLHRLFILIGK